MFNLIRKELLVQKKSIIFGFAYSFFVFFAFNNQSFRPYIYTMGGIAVSFIFFLSIVQAEFKNQSELVIQSLPVSRRQSVAAKYTAMILFTLLAILMVGLVGLGMQLAPVGFRPRLLNFQDIVITLDSVFFMAAIMAPICYKTRGKWVQIMNMILFMLIFFGSSTVFGFISHQQNQAWVQWLIVLNRQIPGGLTALFSLVLFLFYIASFFLSLRIFQRKDF